MKLKDIFVESNKKINYQLYALAKDKVDGLQVVDKVDNMSSISASLQNYTILKGIREVPLSDFDDPKTFFYAKNDFDQSRRLAEKISENAYITPLIVVIDNKGSYILEGAHRFVALSYLGKKTFPALIVIDESDENLNENFEITKGIHILKIGNSTISYSIDDNNIVDLQSLRTTNNNRGAGSAKTIMKKFVEYLDQYKLISKLCASPLDKKTKLNKLVELYKSFGYELTGKHCNIVYEPIMIRYPKNNVDI